MGSLSPWHWAIIAVVVILLFGSKKLPDAARSLGKSLRIFKSEVRELHNEGRSESAPMSSLREKHQAPMSSLREEHQAPMSSLREERQASSISEPAATPVESQRVERTAPPAPEQTHTDAKPA